MATVVQVERLHKRYGERTVLDSVSFGVEDGEIFGVLGPNGAGKTTAVECLSGLRRPDGGTVRVLGLDPRTERDRLRRVLGVQLQESRLADRMRVGEALDLYASFYSEPADWRELMELVGLADRRDTPYAKLSGGQKQRLSIALALIGRPRVAILDEITTGLDPQARRDAWELIEAVRAGGVTIVLVTHFMEEAERLCDRVALFDAGRVAAVDTPAGLVGRSAARQRVVFRPSAPFEDRLLTELPEVAELVRTGARVEVAGSGELLHAVTAALARHQVVAGDLRVHHPTLDDAFVALTGRRLGTEQESPR
ncbi:ABC transporter ATP-binding protein [Allonocardiopsis opalescens]|uniref:ABC-2 type transport system ATP-binding protein n=1 Tax=Allonocardiopsis opalescens TaxID=1144618 RepID=A0A2T0Q5H3_9ACTN|nr:ABC transporter ATP-binding protein [Allonocardiopsis opalescens]PRX99046.1 ABC-2 type transport system ATP-binding protein [Allonocardiopsis opalescens]